VIAVQDVGVIALTLAFFASCVLMSKGLDRLMGR
jgi:hypothetical protein